MTAEQRGGSGRAKLTVPPRRSEKAIQPRGRRKATATVSPVLRALTEAQFQKIVTKALAARGWIWWHVPNMRQTTAGLPDIIAIHAGRPVVLAWELKRESGKPTAMQQAVINVMQGVPGVDARIIRPSDWAAVLEDLDR